MVDLNRRFTSDEVSAIVRRGLEQQSGLGDVSYEELEDIALQSGISAQVLQQAIAEEEAHREREQAKEKWHKRCKRGFYQHLLAYVLVNGFLVTINLMTGGYFWAIWPMLGWGLGLTFDATATFFPNERKLDQHIRRKARRKQQRHAKQQRREREDELSSRMDSACPTS